MPKAKEVWRWVKSLLQNYIMLLNQQKEQHLEYEKLKLHNMKQEKAAQDAFSFSKNIQQLLGVDTEEQAL